MPIPTVRLHLDELFSIIKDGPDPGDEPDLVGRTVSITLTPRMDMTAVVPVEGDPHGYLPETLKYLVGPPILERDPVTGEPVIDPETEEPKLKAGAVQPDMDWPFSVLVANLADPAMLTDATQYSIVVETVDAPRHTSNRKIPSGVDLKPEDTGATIDLMPLLPVAAATPTSPVVKGDEGPPGPPGPPPILSATATPLAPGAAPTAAFTGDPATPLLTLGIPRGDKGDTGALTAWHKVGPGRPDQPATTAGEITGTEPVGTTYTSTDGAGVGAWVWRKRPGATGWQVVDGDTGLVDVTHLLHANWQLPSASPQATLRRERDAVHVALRLKLAENSPLVGASRGSHAPVLEVPPAGWGALTYAAFGAIIVGTTTPGIITTLQSRERITFNSSGAWGAGDEVAVTASYPARGSWPTSLTL